MRVLVGFMVLIGLSIDAVASDVSKILNYLAYSPTFASSGQPTAAQLQVLKDDGFERVFYIAFSDQDRSLPAEDRLVKALGMEYVQIPVDWNAPRPSEFYVFADAMNRRPETRSLLHCQVNARASAFSFLYRTIYRGVPVGEAKAAMNTIWQPNETWRDFIFALLKENDIDPACADCDWTPPKSQ